MADFGVKYQGLSGKFPPWLKDVLEVDYDRSYGDGDRRGIYLHELYVANWLSIWFVDLMFKGSRGNDWRLMTPGFALLVGAGCMQIPSVKGKRGNIQFLTSIVSDDGSYKISQYADTITVIMIGLSGAWFAYKIPYGAMPKLVEALRRRVLAARENLDGVVKQVCLFSTTSMTHDIIYVQPQGSDSVEDAGAVLREAATMVSTTNGMAIALTATSTASTTSRLTSCSERSVCSDDGQRFGTGSTARSSERSRRPMLSIFAAPGRPRATTASASGPARRRGAAGGVSPGVDSSRGRGGGRSGRGVRCCRFSRLLGGRERRQDVVDFRGSWAAVTDDSCVCGGDNPATSERCGFAHGMVQVKVLDTISAETRAARSRSLATLNSLEMATRCPRVIRLLSH